MPEHDRGSGGDAAGKVSSDTATTGREVEGRASLQDALLGAARVAAGGALTAALLAATHVTASDPTEGSQLRVALRTTAGTVRECRRLSEAELAALPMHMRRPEACESRAVAYRLEVHLDDQPLFTRDYTAAGIHGDRPLTVDERFPVATGSHAIRLRFAPADAAASKDLPVFTMETSADFPEGRIRVAALDGSAQRLELR